MPAAVNSAFDVALWFSDKALDDNEYLQPQKLHRLLFLSQAYFAAAFRGRSLMPAVFVAEEMGPIEPNLYKAFANGRPNVDVDAVLDDDVESFLDGIWGRFGHHSVEHLSRIVNQSTAYRKALAQGLRAEIPLQAMVNSFVRPDGAPAVNQVLKSRMMRSQTGERVRVKAWMPGTKSSPGK